MKYGRHDPTGRPQIAASRERNDIQGVVDGLISLADFALQLEEVTVALAAAREGLDIVQRTRFWPCVAMVAGPLAEALALVRVDDADTTIVELERLAAEHEQHVSDAQFLRARDPAAATGR